MRPSAHPVIRSDVFSRAASPSFVAAASKAARQLVIECERLGVLYASEWSPLSDITLALLFNRLGIHWRYRQLTGSAEILWPPMCGIQVMHIDRAQTSGQRRFAMRHGLGHVLAGHVADIAYSHDGHDWRCWQETVADLFALIDVIPDHKIQELEAAGYSRREIEHWSYAEIARWTGWEGKRISERVSLRLGARP